MFKHAILVLSAALLTATNVLACTNAACQVANSIYKECKYSTTNIDALRKCLCTDKFIVNYNRCLNGFVCAWDGNPSTLNQPCIALYCPGTFDGGFDAIAFCRGTLTSSYPPLSTSSVKPSSSPTPTKSSTIASPPASSSSSTKPVVTYVPVTVIPPPNA